MFDLKLNKEKFTLSVRCVNRNKWQTSSILYAMQSQCRLFIQLCLACLWPMLLSQAAYSPNPMTFIFVCLGRPVIGDLFQRVVRDAETPSSEEVHPTLKRLRYCILRGGVDPRGGPPIVIRGLVLPSATHDSCHNE